MRRPFVTPATRSTRGSSTGSGRRLLFNRVPESKTVKNRLHVDVHTGPGKRDATAARLQAHVATLIRQVKQPGGERSVRTDPEGNEFYVAGHAHLPKTLHINSASIGAHPMTGVAGRAYHDARGSDVTSGPLMIFFGPPL